MLFILHVNELPTLIKSDFKMFADDAKLFRGINNDTDAKILQDDLNVLSEWSKDWLLQFNISKCKVMHVGHSNPCHDYTMRLPGGDVTEKLAASKVERDLGVHVTDTLKATTHCQIAARKASSALRLLKMAFPTLKISNFKPLYTTYVRPHIEYCMQAVGPFLRKDIKVLESVQHELQSLYGPLNIYRMKQGLES